MSSELVIAAKHSSHILNGQRLEMAIMIIQHYYIKLLARLADL